MAGNKVYETQVAYMQNMVWYVLLFYALFQHNKSKWSYIIACIWRLGVRTITHLSKNQWDMQLSHAYIFYIPKLARD